MATEKILNEKKAAVTALAEKLKASNAVVLVDYRGIDVADDTALRKELREAGVEYKVIKNTIMRYACEEAGILPDISIELKRLGKDHYLLKHADNGPGIPEDYITKVYCQMFAGSKFRNIQSSGQQG